MANPAPTINQINAFNATQGTTIDFNIIGGTELVRSNRIYIYDLSDNSLICTHLYVSTESIHELPANTDGSIVYESGKSSADFVNGAQYYAQIQTFTDIAGTEGGSGLSVAKMFWCLVDPTLTITTIPSTISTTSYNVSATYNANTNVVSNIIQQYQFNLYSATGSLLQSSGVIVGNGEQQGTSTTYDISYNFAGLSVGSSYYVVVEVTTTQGMSVSAQSNTFTVSIDTPTLGEATVVNNACDGYISVTSNLSSEYGGSGSGEIVSFETDSENVFTKLQVDLDPIQDLHGYDAPWVGGAGKNKLPPFPSYSVNGATFTANADGSTTATATSVSSNANNILDVNLPAGTYYLTLNATGYTSKGRLRFMDESNTAMADIQILAENEQTSFTVTSAIKHIRFTISSGATDINLTIKPQLETNGYTAFAPYENICPISGHDEVDVEHTGVNVWDEEWELGSYDNSGQPVSANNIIRTKNYISVLPSTGYYILAPYNGVLYYYDATNTFISLEGFNANGATKTTPTNCRYVRFRMASDYGTTYNNDISINYPSTDHEYHSYQGQSYTQEIEVTYTPTVQENTPYLFKQTGDVGGDRETIELVGGTVAWNQLVKNAGTNTAYGLTATIDTNGKLTISGQLSSYGDFRVYGGGVEIPKGHKLLFGGASAHFGARLQGSSTYVSSAQKSRVLSAGTGWISDIVVHSDSGSATLGETYNESFYPQCFDLTQMFGSTIADYIYSLEQAHAGDGVAFFRNLFPKPYYAYNAGELISVNATSHNTVGKNLNPYSGVNYVVDNSKDRFFLKANTYTLSTDNGNQLNSGANYYIRLYDAKTSGNIITDGNITSNRLSLNGDHTMYYGGSGYASVTFTLAVDAWVCFGFNNVTPTTCNAIQLEVGSNVTDYEPYIKNTYPLDADLELRGMLKLDISNKLYYDGDTYKHDGSVNRKFGIVDLGTIIWQENNITVDGNPAKLYRGPLQNSALVYNSVACICPKYPTVLSSARKEKTMSVGTSDGSVDIIDSTYDNAVNFKTAMSGVYLVYELATPTTETADAFEEIQKVTPIYGTEEFVDSRTVPMPVYANTQYLTRDIYGGYIDLVNGLLVLTHGIVDLGTLNYSPNGVVSGIYQYIAPVSGKAYGAINIISDVFVASEVSATNGTMRGRTSSTNVVFNTTIATKEDFKTEMNGHQLCYELAEPMIFQLTPQQIQTLVGKNNVWSEDGEISLAYHIPITNLLVKRQDVDDVSGSWLTLYSQPITQASDMDFTFIDFTNQYGKTYKYALVPLLTQTQSGVEVEVEGGYTVSDEVQSVFDGVFIVDSTGSQKCKANVGYGNVDMNQTVGTITPIGAKYPVVITNSKNQYHNGSISGTIVPDDYYFNGNLSRIDMVNKRDELEQFLTNKRAKIIKDWNGKIWLVMIMDNVSCTFNNNYGMGIVNFSTNWVEVGDPTNQQDLQATGLISVGGA